MESLRCLSIRQPDAWLVVIGLKDVENRTRPIRIRGTILIHAGRDRKGLDAFLQEHSDLRIDPSWFPLGAIIGSVDLEDCQQMNESLESNIWAAGPYCYHLRHAKWFRQPIPCKGQVGFFSPPPSAMSEIQRQLAEPSRPVTELSPVMLAEVKARQHRDILLIRGEEQIDRGDLVRALQIANEGIKAYPANPGFHALKGRACYVNKKYEGALLSLQQALRFAPNDPELFYLSGKAKLHLGELAGAEADGLKARDLAPNDAYIHTFLGEVYETSNQWQKALESYKMANVILFDLCYGPESEEEGDEEDD
jgi:tetratricopeptide (TPR) repeat protein